MGHLLTIIYATMLTYDSVRHLDDVTKRQFLQGGASWHPQHPEQLMPVVRREDLTTDVLEQRQERLSVCVCVMYGIRISSYMY